MVSESVERGATDNENHAPVGKTRRTAFWGIALLIVGAAIGFLLGSTSGDRSEAQSPNRQTQDPRQEYPGQGASPWRAQPQPDERPDVAHSPAATDAVSDPTRRKPSLPAPEPGRLTGTIEFGGPGPRVPVDVTATRVAEPTGEAKTAVGRTVAAASPTFAFRFVGLDPGSYVLEVCLPLGASLATTTTTVVAGSNEIVLRARVPENGETLVLRAFAPNGEAIDSKELVVSVGREGTDGFAARGGVSGTRSDGTVVVPLVVPVSGAEVAFLNVQWLGYGAIRVPVTDARDGELVVRFPQRVTVTVRLDSRPPRGQRLGVVLVPRGRSLDAGAPKFYETWFDGGERRIEHAAPGASDLVIVTATVASSSHLRELARHSVTVEARDNVFALPVPLLGTLVLRTDASFAELYPAELPRIRRRFASASAKLGLIRFDAVPAGEWRVVAYKRDDVPLGETIVRVPAPGILDFQPAARIEVAVRELDPDGESAKAGLKAGDLIVSVNGESLTTGFAWASRLRSVLKSPAVQIGVRRGGAMITLEVPGRVFDSRAVSGAVLRLR